MDNLSAAIYPPFLIRGFSGFHGLYPASFPNLPRGGEILRNQVATSLGMGWRLKSESGGAMNRNRVATCVGIRNLFEAKVLETELNGKKFNSKTKDSKTEYGKTVFAEKVVRANQKSINFDGFRDVLDRFTEVLEDYKGRIDLTPEKRTLRLGDSPGVFKGPRTSVL
jgi:hypothetical protein